jgi:hypothetical protein
VKVQALQTNNEDAVLSEVFVRFLIGGTVVSGFTLLGSIFKPTTFAGLFGAAPSVALATLTLAIWKECTVYATVECRSMMAGALALCLYSILTSQLLSHTGSPLWGNAYFDAAVVSSQLSACGASKPDGTSTSFVS